MERPTHITEAAIRSCCDHKEAYFIKIPKEISSMWHPSDDPRLSARAGHVSLPVERGAFLGPAGPLPWDSRYRSHTAPRKNLRTRLQCNFFPCLNKCINKWMKVALLPGSPNSSPVILFIFCSFPLHRRQWQLMRVSLNVHMIPVNKQEIKRLLLSPSNCFWFWLGHKRRGPWVGLEDTRGGTTVLRGTG